MNLSYSIYDVSKFFNIITIINPKFIFYFLPFLFLQLYYNPFYIIINLQNKTLHYFLSIISLAATSPVAAAVTIFPALPAPSPTKYIL